MAAVRRRSRVIGRCVLMCSACGGCSSFVRETCCGEGPIAARYLLRRGLCCGDTLLRRGRMLVECTRRDERTYPAFLLLSSFNTKTSSRTCVCTTAMLAKRGASEARNPAAPDRWPTRRSPNTILVLVRTLIPFASSSLCHQIS